MIIAATLASAVWASAVLAAAAVAGGAPAPAPAPAPTFDKACTDDVVAARQRPLVWMSEVTSAPQFRTPGMALLKCTVTAAGDARDCQVESETPPGQGFGAAALAMAWDLHFQPATACGRPVDAETYIPIRFAPPSGRAPAMGPPPSPRALALARRLLAALHADEALDARIRRFAALMVSRRIDPRDPAQRQALEEALVQSFAARKARMLDEAATSFARGFSGPELETAAQSLAAHAGPPPDALAQRLDQTLDAAVAGAQTEARWQALAGYCARTKGCPEGLVTGVGRE